MEPLLAARLQMALTLGFHIVFACFGMGLPVLLLVAEGHHLKTGDAEWKTLARRWSKVFAVLFAVGAVKEPSCWSSDRRGPDSGVGRRRRGRLEKSCGRWSGASSPASGS